MKKNNQHNICVIGGGNIGTQFACKCASQGYNVCLYTAHPLAFSPVLEIVDEHETVTTGRLNRVTDNMQLALENSDIVFVTYPAFLLEELAEQMLPHLHSGMTIIMIPGTGGAEFAFHRCIEAGAVLCGLQRVPSIARIVQYGKRVRCEGLRRELFLASIPLGCADEFARFLSSLWGIPCRILPNYLNATLTPSNPILHTTRLRTLFSDYQAGMVYERNPLFYGEWSDDSSELLLACDAELQELLKSLGELDLHMVRSLKEHYESDTVPALTKKLCSIKSLHNLKSPMRQEAGGWVPDFQSRYFTADFPYGLAIIEAFADLLRVGVPNIHATMEWYRQIVKDPRRFRLEAHGINSKADIIRFYQR